MNTIPPLRHAALVVLVASLVAVTGCKPSGTAAPAAKPAPAPVFAAIETEQGTIEIELLPAVAPKTVENFRLLAERGYYNGLTFHRIVKGFMIQGGDPLGNGMGGESAWGGAFENEIDKMSPLYRDGYKRGTVAMANAGPDTNGSQFFIVQKDYPLPADYTIFGRVTRGIEVVDALAETPTTRGIDGGMSKPVTPPKMRTVTVRTAAATSKQ